MARWGLLKFLGILSFKDLDGSIGRQNETNWVRLERVKKGELEELAGIGEKFFKIVPTNFGKAGTAFYQDEG